MQRDLKTRGLAIVCAMGLAVGAAACGGADQPESIEDRDPMATSETPTQDPAFGADAQQEQEARVTGCLQRGEIDGTFVLAQARPEGEAGSVGTTGAQAMGTEQYRLIHTGDTDLSTHVGSRVSITGRFQSSSGVSAPDTGMQPGSGAPTADTAPRDDLGADATGGMEGDTAAGVEGTAGPSTQIVVENVERVEGECPAK